MIRAKSINLTKYLEQLLFPQAESTGDQKTETAQPYQIITPLNPAERGAQLSIRLESGFLLEEVLKALKANGVVVDARKPNVIRVAPAPLYNTYGEVWEFAKIFREVCRKVVIEKRSTKDAEKGDRSSLEQQQDQSNFCST